MEENGTKKWILLSWQTELQKYKVVHYYNQKRRGLLALSNRSARQQTKNQKRSWNNGTV